jgi:hypothetical protein
MDLIIRNICGALEGLRDVFHSSVSPDSDKYVSGGKMLFLKFYTAIHLYDM